MIGRYNLRLFRKEVGVKVERPYLTLQTRQDNFPESHPIGVDGQTGPVGSIRVLKTHQCHEGKSEFS